MNRPVIPEPAGRDDRGEHHHVVAVHRDAEERDV
jgi:hypothetical protein